MGFAKPIEQYLASNLLTKIHVFMYLKDIIRGEITMCTILDNAINKGIEQGIEQGIKRGITQGENLKLIMMIQKKMKKGDSVSKIADDLVEEEMTILPIYNIIEEHPEDTEKDIYLRLNKN